MTTSKRAFDLVVSVVLGVVSLPLTLVVAAAVRAESPGPVLFRGERVGRGGRPFVVLKFRTMRTDVAGAAVTRAGDSRITRVGQTLRLTKLDELPQLWNVIRGDMSLVGPRPEDPRYVAGYTAAQRRLLDFRPGLTSPASVVFRHEEALLAHLGGDLESAYREHVLPAKLAIDGQYFPRAGFRSDLAVLVRTVGAVVRPPSLEEQLARLDAVNGAAGRLGGS